MDVIIAFGLVILAGCALLKKPLHIKIEHIYPPAQVLQDQPAPTQTEQDIANQETTNLDGFIQNLQDMMGVKYEDR